MSKLNFALRRNPRIPPAGSSCGSIPEPFKAVLIFSADFELAWAWRYSKSSDTPYETAIRKAAQERAHIPLILQHCDRYQIPMTWATVGHLFLERCEKGEGKPHPNLKRLNYFENKYWKFSEGDWFSHDPCVHWKEAPAWYAPDLIKMILDSGVNHEIGCHTFSHIDCRDAVCPPDIFSCEIRECLAAAEKYGVRLESFVHPGHTIGNLDVLRNMGFRAFRTDDGNILGYPERHENGLWEFRNTMELAFRKGWSVKYHIYRYTQIVERAIRHNRVCNFWFHPSMASVFVEEIMPALFEFISARRKEIWVGTMGDYVRWAEEHRSQAGKPQFPMSQTIV